VETAIRAGSQRAFWLWQGFANNLSECGKSSNRSRKEPRRAVVKDFIRSGIMTTVFVAVTALTVNVAAHDDVGTAGAPSDAELVRAEVLMSEMLGRIRQLRATGDVEERRALMAALRRELELLDATERGDRICPMCSIFLDAIEDANGSGSMTAAGVFFAAYPRVPLSDCAYAVLGTAAGQHCRLDRGEVPSVHVF
jgi:hypothetical protein